MPNNKELLIALGLNDLEADVYILLLQEEHLTGYKIGKLLNKPTANVYKAISSLAIKGAVILEDEQTSYCKAIPVDEFCEMVEAAIKRKTREIKENFSLATNEVYDEKSYQIRSVDLVLEKSRNMLRTCNSIAMLDVFPELLELIEDEVRAAIGRGVEVYLQVYKPVEITGARIVFIDISSKVLKYWKSQQLNLIIDGKEHLLALLSQDLETVFQATWSRNLYLSAMLHMGFSNHFTIFRIRELPESPEYYKEVKHALEQQRILSGGEIPGVAEILKRFSLQ